MYYILINDISSDFDSTLNEPTDLPRDVNFISGSIITHKFDNPLIFTTNAKSGDTMVDFSRGSITLMSKLFLELLQKSGVDNLQVFPAIVKSEEDGTTWNNYFAVNVLGMVSCAVLSKSTYNEIMPGHYIFSELAIDSSKGKDALLFRLQEHSPTILVHRDVIRYIIDNDPDENLLGWEFENIIQ
jgi:hypothetical protein